MKKYEFAFQIVMIERLVDVKKKDLGSVFLIEDKPFLSQVDHSSTVDKHEKLYSLVLFGVFDLLFKFCIAGNRIDFVVNVFAFEEFLQ